MLSGGTSFRGTTHEQDANFKNKQRQLIQQIKFPEEFKEPLDINRVVLSSIRPWISRKVTKILGFEDDVLIDTIINMIEDKHEKLDPRALQVKLTGFLEGKTPKFVLGLWRLLLSASKSANGVPPELVEEEKERYAQLKREKEQVEKNIERKRVEMGNRSLGRADRSPIRRERRDSSSRRYRSGSRRRSVSPRQSRDSVSPRRQSTSHRRRYSSRYSYSPERRYRRRSPSPLYRRRDRYRYSRRRYSRSQSPRRSSNRSISPSPLSVSSGSSPAQESRSSSSERETTKRELALRAKALRSVLLKSRREKS